MAVETTIRVRQGVSGTGSGKWGTVNPTLAAGEFGFETDTGLLKIGNGSANWNTLTYVTDGSKLTGSTLSSNITNSNLQVLGTITNLVATAGTITTFSATTATITGLTVTNTITGNSATSTKLATARNINNVAFDGTADITVTAAADTLTGDTLKSTVTKSSLQSLAVPSVFSTGAPLLRINASNGTLYKDTIAYLPVYGGTLTGSLVTSGTETAIYPLVLTPSYSVASVPSYRHGAVQNIFGSLYFDSGDGSNAPRGRTVIPTVNTIVTTSNSPISNVTTVQNIFGKSLPLELETFYEFDIQLFIYTTSNTSKNITFSIPGMNHEYGPRMSMDIWVSNVNTAGATISAANAYGVVCVSNVRTTTSLQLLPQAQPFYPATIRIKGTYYTGSQYTDTFNPSIKFDTAAPGADSYLALGSYAKIWGVYLANHDTYTSSIGAWA
jgi:hypothetical protein